MSEKSGYQGKIKNGGTQMIQAPSQTVNPKGGSVKTGSDLRTGKK